MLDKVGSEIKIQTLDRYEENAPGSGLVRYYQVLEGDNLIFTNKDWRQLVFFLTLRADGIHPYGGEIAKGDQYKSLTLGNASSEEKQLTA